MKKIGRFLTNPLVISSIGLLLISILIWYAGPYIKFGDSNNAPLSGVAARLLAIIIVVVLWGLNNLRVQLKSNKHNQNLVEDIQQSNLDVSGPLSRQADEEIAQINDRFLQAMTTLKKIKFIGRKKRRALYELPWYIIVGPPGSGKTTALINSGLDFPLAEQLGKGAVQGIGGTRNCDWWFTNEAVLIDTAGRYTTQDSHRVIDSSAWEGFLDILKRNRRRRPINGAIVAISLQDLLIQTEEERVLHAKTIRLRLDELMERLEIRFPIYLMFTKVDLVSGFNEFFEDLGREDREQVWGISLPNAQNPSQGPDFEFLHEELHHLSKRLYERVLWRMHQERDIKRCAAIEGFPVQMENLTTLVESFINQTFVQNRYQYQPYLRGIYFSSGTQDGSPIDRLMTSISSNFGFARDSVQRASHRGKSFFISQLFRDVIFPEAELVGSNTRYENLIRWSQRMAYLGLAVVAVTTLFLWGGSVTRHNAFISEVEGHVAEFTDEKKHRNLRGRDISAVLLALNALAKANNVRDSKDRQWLSGVGLYDNRIDSETNSAYAAQLEMLFLPKLLDTLEGTLRGRINEGDLYNTFRVYLMFNKLEYMNQASVQEWFDKYWAKAYQGNLAQRQELQYHLRQLLSYKLQPSKLNDQLVNQTRTALLRVPISQRIYGQIKANPDYSYDVNMLDHYGESVRRLFKMNVHMQTALSVPVLFTVQGYKDMDFSVSSPVIADAINERWVLMDGDSNTLNLVNQDLKEISEQVKDHYMADYAKTWSDIYAALEVENHSDLREVNDALASFVDPVYSPLFSILQVGQKNTQLTTPVLDDLAEAQPSGKIGMATDYLASRVEGTLVDKRFEDLNNLLRETSRNPAPINTTMQRLEELKAFVQDIMIAPDPAKKSFEIAKMRYQNGTANPITALRVYAKSTPEPVQRWLTSLSDETWRIVLQSAHQHVSSEWRARVYAPYAQGLAGRYPLNRRASDELALLDFSAFFKPRGTVDNFFSEYMKPFIDTRGRWANHEIDNHTIGFSPTAINEMKKAVNIRNVYFSSNADIPSISLELRPYSMNKTDARFTLDMGEERLTYSHGPKFWRTVSWSGNNDSKRIRMVFEDLHESSIDKLYVGPWAWLRMMDDSEIKQTKQTNVYLLSFSAHNNSIDSSTDEERHTHKIVYEGKATSIHNPFRNDLLASFRCPESI